MVSYICGAWFIYSFGCSFGARNFVEYTALFALPFAGMLTAASDWKWRRWILGVFLLGCMLTTQKLFFAFNKCFFGENDWDVVEYQRLLFRGYYRKTLTPVESSYPYIALDRLETKSLPTLMPFEQFRLAIRLENPSSRTAWVLETYTILCSIGNHTPSPKTMGLNGFISL